MMNLRIVVPNSIAVSEESIGDQHSSEGRAEMKFTARDRPLDESFIRETHGSIGRQSTLRLP